MLIDLVFFYIQVPEISVTTPTPQGSTTKVYTYFAKDSKDLGATKLDKLQAQAAALIHLADRPPEDPDENSENSSSSDTDDERKSTKRTESRRQQQRPGVSRPP